MTILVITILKYITLPLPSLSFFNKARYTATLVAWGWAEAIFEVTWAIGQEQRGQRPQENKVKCDRRTDGRTDQPTDKGVESLRTRLKTERATIGPLGLFFLLFPSLSILWPLLWSHSMQLYIPFPLVLQLVDWSVSKSFTVFTFWRSPLCFFELRGRGMDRGQNNAITL